jgi:hypothetical protein
MKFRPLSSVTAIWLAYFIVAPCMVLFIYASVQHNYRQSANDPQIQLVAEAVGALSFGTEPARVIADLGVSKSRLSLSTSVTIFDSQRHPLASSSTRNPELMPPVGSFDNARDHGQNRFTWQPAPSTRQAAVLEHTNANGEYYVLADRGLGEVEAREKVLFDETLLALAGVIGLGIILAAISRKP